MENGIELRIAVAVSQAGWATSSSSKGTLSVASAGGLCPGCAAKPALPWK